MTRPKFLLLATSMLASLIGVAAAQPAHTLATTQGTVQHFTLTPVGTIAGLQLSNGAQVFAPPFMSTQIAYAVKLGDQVTVRGVTMGPVLRAVQITDATSHQTVTVPRKPFHHDRVHHDRGAGATVQGRVASVINGPHDRHFGVMLTNGTELALPPAAFKTATMADLMKPGASVMARGAERTSALGTVLKVRKIGADSSHLTNVTWPHWHHRHHPKPDAQPTTAK